MGAPFCFLNIYKPKGITSFDVIFRLRKILNIKKIGHAGTLDPMAKGVMQVAVGNASRLLEFLNSDKEYIAEVKFGYSSTTLDIEGEITEAKSPKFTKEELIDTLQQFTGETEQIPPKFSAIKVGGKKLCDIARKKPDMEIEIPKRTVKIYSIELIDFKDYTAQIKVRCSKGTYIRTLASDIAKKLETDAYLTDLTRTVAGNFKIEDSIQIEETDLNKNGIEPNYAIDLVEYKLDSQEFELVKNGVAIAPKAALDCTDYIKLTYNSKLVSIGILSDNKIKIKKFFGF